MPSPGGKYEVSRELVLRLTAALCSDAGVDVIASLRTEDVLQAEKYLLSARDGLRQALKWVDAVLLGDMGHGPGLGNLDKEE